MPLPWKGDFAFLIPDLNPVAQEGLAQFQVVRDLAEGHVRLLDELDGFLLELGGEAPTFTHG